MALPLANSLLGAVVTKTASSEFSGSFLIASAYDLNLTTQWASSEADLAAPPAWLQVQFDTPRMITHYAVIAHNAAQSPSNFTFEGSADGAAWTVLDTQTGQTFTSTTENVYTLTPSVAYLYYRFSTTSVHGGTTVNITEFDLAFFGAIAVLSEILVEAPPPVGFLPVGDLLELWLPYEDTAIPEGYFDWGTRPQKESADRQFRVHNLSALYVATDVTVVIESSGAQPAAPADIDEQHLFSLEGPSGRFSVAIRSTAPNAWPALDIEPGGVSEVITLRRNIASNCSAGGPYSFKVSARPASWY